MAQARYHSTWNSQLFQFVASHAHAATHAADSDKTRCVGRPALERGRERTMPSDRPDPLAENRRAPRHERRVRWMDLSGATVGG